MGQGNQQRIKAMLFPTEKEWTIMDRFFFCTEENRVNASTIKRENFASDGMAL